MCVCVCVCVCVCEGVGLGKTMSFSLVPKPLARHSVLFVQMHMSGASTEMLSTPQPDQSFRRTHELKLLAPKTPACVVRLLLF